MNPESKKHRAGYVTMISVDDTDEQSMAFYTGDTWSKWMGQVRKWCVDNGYSSPLPAQAVNAEGHLKSPIDFGLYVEKNDSFRVDRYNKATVALVNAQRADWPTQAKEICERYERKIYELFHVLDNTLDARDAGIAHVKELTLKIAERKIYELFHVLDNTLDARDAGIAHVKELTLKIAEMERQVCRADDAASELRKRIKEVDVDRLRRDITAEVSQKTEALAEENRRLAASLHEATLQATKLAEDKRRLRSALNSARGR